MNNPRALSGKTILITRPLEQAQGLSKLVSAAGGMPVVFPAIEIKPASDQARLKELLAHLDDFDLAIFISPTAVACAWKQIASAGGWPKNLQAATVGQGSARALSDRGVENIIVPAGQSDSEALLAQPALQEISGKRIVIFRGEGGREVLGKTLVQRGAHVEYAECYRRAKPERNISELINEYHTFSAIVLTSRESVENFRDLAGAAWPQLTLLPVFVPHERVADACRKAGMHTVLTASDGDAGMAQAMIKFFQP